jgi:hypothetical protein
MCNTREASSTRSRGRWTTWGDTVTGPSVSSQDTLQRDDALDTPRVGPADHRQEAVCLRESIQNDIQWMVRMNVHEVGVNE